MIRPLLVKEVKDLLRDPRILVPFILSALLMPVIALVVSVPMKYAAEQALTGFRKVGFVDLDGGPYSSMLKRWLESRGFSVTELSGANMARLGAEAASRGLGVVLVLPKGFSEAIARGRQVNLTILSVVDEISIFSGVETQPVVSAVREFYLSRVANESSLSLETLLDPVVVTPRTYISSKASLLEADPSTLFGLVMAALLVPLVVMSMAMVVMQMSATSMAVENEERTLETLLTMPVPARDILAGKLLGMFVVSLVGSVLEVAGIALYFIVYFAAFSDIFARVPSGQASVQLQLAPQLGVIDASQLLLLAPSLLISLFFAAALGVVIGALSRDVRIANTLVSPISMLIFLPGYLVAFAPSKLLGPVGKAALYLFPLTQPTILAKDIVSSRPPVEAPAYIALSVILTLLLVYASSYVLSLETLARLQRAAENIAQKFRRQR